MLWFMSENVLPMFSPRNFMVPCLIFGSLNHFEFILVYYVRECSNFIDLHAAVQLSQHHLLKRLSFLHCMFLPLLSKNNWLLGIWVYFWALYCVTFIHMSVFNANATQWSFDYCNFLVLSWVWEIYASNLVLFKIALSIQSFIAPYTF